MKKIAVLAMAVMFAGAVFAQSQTATTKKEPAKTEKACCKKDGKACAEKKDAKACDKKDGKACCAEKKAETKK